jgi:ATP-binding cassette subfamily G (WHITE) protein 2 (SNQ2)
MAHTPASDTATLATLNESRSRVDIRRAEAEFTRLQRQFTIHDDSGRAQSSTPQPKHLRKDLENAPSEDGDEEPFDLREYLTSSNDASQAAGIKHKHVGVTWEDLQVTGIGGEDNKIFAPTFLGAIMGTFMFPVMLVWGLVSPLLPSKYSPAPPTRTIIHKNSGLLKPGEMCLVLGCPGSGCTTFLKSIANKRASYFAITGDVRYAGIDHLEMTKHYNGEVLYNQEDDQHIPTLTVSQTLDFALATKAPGPKGRLPGVRRKAFIDEVKDLLLRMLNISHTKQTLVGDAFVRGVSGGERKRVSIAEMMTTRARVQSWDNSTRGLDASTALDLIKSLRIMTDILGQTTFVSLYQAGEGIYDLFDKVIVIDKGRQVYFGPTSEARSYFEALGYKSLPRQSTADYLTGCTDPNERQFAPGRSTADVPSNPQALEHAFRASAFYGDMASSLEKYKVQQAEERRDQEAFRAAVLDDKKKGVSKKSPYTLGFYGQVKALTVRQFQTKVQDKFQLYTSFGLAIILSFVIGAAYFDLPLTAAGGFTRGSVIFMAVLVAIFDAFGEVPLMLMGRSILNKQTGYSMYRRAAFPVANLLSDLPFSALRIFTYNVVVYFMTGLHRSAGAFWTFHLISYTTFLSMQGFFRTFGLCFQNFDTAFRMSVIFFPNIVQYSGYLIPEFLMKRWLFWIYYINPFSYSWAGLMENEFSRVSLVCEGAYVVPRNGPGIDKYPNIVGPNQACTLYGSQPGSSIVSGADYIKAGFSLDVNDLWRRNFLVVVGFFIFFIITQMLVIEYLQGPSLEGIGFSIFAKETTETAELNATLREKQNAPKRIEEKEDKLETKEKPSFEDRKTFTWERVDYTVPVPGGSLRLLHEVSGYVKPGTMTALMGASGAGKTTCLDVLAQRKNIGVISGDLLIGGKPLGSDFARGTAYAEQMDVHEGTATVREAMRFSAYLRQPYHIPKEEKDAYIEEVIELLELQPLANALVFSLNVEARKRLTIGVELASKPELLLFLDEPTSGLDGQSAWNIVRFLRKLADQGQAILCTIHQPSALLFSSFDRLLLLEKGGETVYFGDIGEDAATIREYFARYGAICPDNVNPAEHMLDAIGAGLAPRIGDRDWADVWRDSPEFQETVEEIEAIKSKGLRSTIEEKSKISRYSTPFLFQMKTVAERSFVTLWRSPNYIYTRLFIHVVIALIVSLSFLQLGTSARDLQSRVFAIFWVCVMPAIIQAQLTPLWVLNRMIFIREHHSRIYSAEAFAIGQLVSEIPYSALCGILYWVLMVYPIGFGQGSAGLNGTGFQLLVLIFVEFFGVTLAQLIGAISPSIQIAVLFNPLVTTILTTFCGVTIPYPNLGAWARTWLYYLDPFTRVMGAMVSTELHGLKIQCKSNEFSLFDPPSGQTCTAWANEFVSAFGGYLDNPDDTSACRYCPYAVGDDFFLPLNISYGNRWRDVWVLFAFFIFNFILVVIASRFLRFAKR